MKLRIVHIENYFDPEAGYQINELLYASKNFDDEVIVITSKDLKRYHKEYNPEIDRDFEEKTGVKIIRLDTLFKISSRIVLKNLNKTIENLKPDILFMHGIGDFKDLLLWRKKRPYKVVRDCHMSWVASQNKFKNLYYFFFKSFFSPIINNTNKYDVIYSLGVEEYEYLRKLGINDCKIENLPHGYNEDTMYYSDKDRVSIRHSYNFDENDIVISYIGKFNFMKQPDLVFDIFDFLSASFIKDNNLKLLFIGSKDEEYMKIFNKKLSLYRDKIQIEIDDSKEFKDLRKYYSASDICIFPKQTSLSSIHAQVCNCRVIMEDHTSNKERVLDNNNLYSENDFSMAAEILIRIVEELKTKDNKISIEELKKREYKNQLRKLKELSA